MFDKQIMSILNYACDICYMWKQNYDIKKVHLDYLKSLLNIKPSSCTPSVYAECGRFPLVIKQNILALKYWQILLESNINMLIRNAYDSLYECFEFGQKYCGTYVNEILNEIEMTGNKQCITFWEIKAISCKLHENFIMKTLNDISNIDKYPKLHTYKIFKTDIRLVHYLLTLENHGLKIILTKFRISSHNLHIETGRYERPKLEPHLRLCVYCDMQTVENEFLFLLECP